MLQPGPEPHEDGAAHQGAEDDVEHPLVGLPASSGLRDEHQGRDQDAEPDEEPVRGDRDSEDSFQVGKHQFDQSAALSADVTVSCAVVVALPLLWHSTR